MARPRRREIRFKNERILEPPMPEVPLRRLAKQDQKWPAEIPASMRFVHRVVSKWPCDEESRRFAATGPLPMFEYNFPVISPIKYEDFGTDESVLSPDSSVDENSNSPVTPSTSVLPDHSEFATSASQYSSFSVSSAANTRWLPVTVVPGKEPLPTTVAPTDVFGSHDQLSGADSYYANSLSPEPPSSVCLDDVYFDDDASMYADSRRTSISVDNGFDCQHPLVPSVATAYSCASVPQGFESSFSSHSNDHISLSDNRFLQASSVRDGQPYQHSTQSLDSYGRNDFGGSSFQYSPYVADIPSFSATHEPPYIGHSRGISALPSHGSNMYTSSPLQMGTPQYSTQPGPSRDFSIAPELLHGPPTRSVPPPIADHPHFHDHPYQHQQYTPYDVLVYPPEPVNRNTYTTSQPAYMETHSCGPIQSAATWTQQPGPVHRLPQENQPSLPMRRQSGPSSGSHPIQNSPVSVQDPQPLRQSPQLQAESILSQPLLPPQVPKARSPVAKVQTLGSSSKNPVSIDPSCVLPAISPYDVNRAASWTAHFEALGRKGKKKKKVYRRKGAVPSPKPEPSTTTLHQCPLCTRQFERRNGLAIHLKWHYKPQLPLPPIQGLGILVPEQLGSKSPAPPNSPEHVDIPEGSLGDGATADDGPAQPRTNVLSIDSLLNVPTTPSEHAPSGTPFSTPPSSSSGSRKASVDDTEDAPPRSENAGSIWDLFGTEG